MKGHSQSVHKNITASQTSEIRNFWLLVRQKPQTISNHY